MYRRRWFSVHPLSRRPVPEMSLKTEATLLIGVILILVNAGWTLPSPAFSTRAAESGVVGSNFVVLLPILNSGTGVAANLTITSVAMGAAVSINPALPLALGNLAPAASNQLVLQFDSNRFVVGGTYLLTVRGTYQLGATTLAFAVNRFLAVTVPSSSVQSDLERWVALDAIKTEVNSLPHLDPVADAQSILSFLRSRPEFVDEGIYPDSSSIWARFADGLPIIIGNDFFPLSSSQTSTAFQATGVRPAVQQSTLLTAQAAVTGADLPASSSYRLLNTLQQLADPTLIGNLSSWLQDNNYVAASADTTVAGLKTVGGDGIFFFRTHAGFILNEAKTAYDYALWTSEQATFDNYIANFDNGDVLQNDSPLVLFEALQSGNPDVSEWHWAITAKFVEKYWGAFSQNSLVYIDACDSDGAEDFRQEMFNEDASVYAGWTGNVGDPFAANTARIVFDRLLGANQYCPETNPAAVQDCVTGKATPPIFAQRPFDYRSLSTVEFNSHTNVGFFKNVLSNHFGLTLNFTPGTGSFAQLAPSISNMEVDEIMGPSGQLTIHGSFGEDPRQSGSAGDGIVTVGGPNSPADIVSWNNDEIVVNLTSSGPGSSGDVQVTVRNHRSNVARLTEWQSTFRGLWKGAGSIQESATYQPAFRLDLRKYRPKIHDVPIEPASTAAPVEFFGISSPSVSTGRYAASGTGTYTDAPGLTDTFTLTGSGTLILEVPGTPPPPHLFTMFGFLFSSTQMLVGIGPDGTALPVNFTEVACDPNGCSTGSGQAPFCPGVGGGGLLTLDENAVIQGNNFSENVSCLDGFSFTPGSLSWSNIAPLPDTAPDPKSAR